VFVCTLFWMALQRHHMKWPGAARTEKAFNINVPSAIVRSIASCCACSAGCPAMIAWEAAAGPTERRQGSRCARPAPPAHGLDRAPLARLFCFHAFMACCARLRSSCRESARSQHYSVMWRGLRPFCGSPRLATVAPWLPLTNRSYGVRWTAPHLTISTTMRVRPRVLVDDERSALRRHGR
jgi:hypothetical protein